METHTSWLALPVAGCWVTAQGCVCRLYGDLNMARRLSFSDEMRIRGILYMYKLTSLPLPFFTFKGYTVLSILKQSPQSNDSLTDLLYIINVKDTQCWVEGKMAETLAWWRSVAASLDRRWQLASGTLTLDKHPRASDVAMATAAAAAAVTDTLLCYAIIAHRGSNSNQTIILYITSIWNRYWIV